MYIVKELTRQCLVMLDTDQWIWWWRVVWRKRWRDWRRCWHTRCCFSLMATP